MTRLASLIARRQAPFTKLRDMPKPPVGERFPLPAPSMGMNTRDSVNTLDLREARTLKNFVCESGKIVVRKGRTAHQTVTGASNVTSLWTHSGEAAQVLLGAANGKIWDVTGTPTELGAGPYTSDRWSMAQMDDTTVGVNGADTPWSFDGTVFGASGLSGAGLTIANLRTAHVVGTRMWFTEKNKARVWYLPVDSVTGVLTAFQLGLQTKGGYCVGVYEYRKAVVFVMSTGQVVAYRGDPGNDFAQAGDYAGPVPVGYDPGVNVGSDLIIMTAAGPAPMEALASGVAFDSTGLATWGKIAPSWVADVASFGTLAGWNAVYFKGLVIFNIPTDVTTSKQWVYNTRTAAWSFWGELNAAQFAEHGGTLYFGRRDVGKVAKYAGGTDEGTAITAVGRGAFFLPFGSKLNGQYTLVRLSLTANGGVTAQLQIDVDGVESGISAPEVPIASPGTGPWDGPWDGPWGTTGDAQLLWSGVAGFGCSVSPVFSIASLADSLEVFGFDVIGAQAGPIG
jgi:hypothetical protein